METATDEKSVGVSRKRYFMAGIIGAVIATVLNCIYHAIYMANVALEVEGVTNYLTVILATVVSLILSALVYYWLSRNTKSPLLIYLILLLAFTVGDVSFIAVPVFPSWADVPEGFVGWALPLHLIASAVAAIFIPKYVTSGKKE